MNRTLEQNRTLSTVDISEGNVIVPFDIEPNDKATRIRQHLENCTSLNVLTIAQRLLRPAVIPTGPGPSPNPIPPQY
ncbi:hypothetical protein [Leptothoe spongobia]|uniref:Uncharacterized protein n=1 Tax=Leptothoe spongobia TAU-MAC 1115 TaxID=1967444 RepID=A0A947GIQ4_9CYAN|nr:hypothetical protein [Leptothoe spongobia]MBT9315864.1 hypothetical protein [Leptothoe spongobia TAU-MAC 1115]